MTVNDNEWQDWPEYECCGRGAMIQYRRGLNVVMCLEGGAYDQFDFGLQCSDSERMFGELQRLL